MNKKDNEKIKRMVRRGKPTGAVVKGDTGRLVELRPEDKRRVEAMMRKRGKRNE